MRDIDELRKEIEERVGLVRQKYFLRREIFDLEQDVAYMKKNNLSYIDRELRIRLSVEEIKTLIENREKRIKKIESEEAKYDRTGKAGNY